MHVLISAVSSARCPSGICRHAANLAVSLALRSDISRVSLLVGPWQESYFRQAFHLAGKGVAIRTVDVGSDAFGRNLWYYRTLPEVSLQAGADIVQLSFPAPIVRRRFSCPVVCSVHDLYPYDMPANFGAARVVFNRYFLRQCLRQSDAVVCSSDFTRNRLQFHAPAVQRSKAARIYQSVSLAPTMSRPPAWEPLHSHSFLLAVAQHRSNKNLALLISAFAAFRRRFDADQERKLVIIGAEGPETKFLRALVEKHSLPSHVLFQSALPDAELCWLYRHSALVVVPSRIEGFCLPLAEALQCGSNVLCSDIPVLREVGGNHCQYFSLEAGDPVSELADSIAAALRDPKVNPATTHRFAPAEIASQYVALYRSLLSGSPRSGVGGMGDEDVLSQEQYAV